MNYYINGNAAKADQIKAAFEKLGYDVTGFDMCNDNILFFTYKLQTGANVISTTNAHLYTANIIKTHPDYKELKLPVDSNFKAGDWVVFNNSHNSIYQITEIKNFLYILTHTHGGSMALSFSQEELIRPWTIEDAEDGDILVTTKIRSCPFIYRKTGYNNHLAYYYAGIDGDDDFCEGCLKRTLYHFGPVSNVVPATKEQRDLLLAKMQEAGYEWDERKKELREINSHYDISNFQPFDYVLTRDGDMEYWNADLFSSYHDEFHCFRGSWEQCIPFNEDTKRLLGTTDMCGEEYINW